MNSDKTLFVSSDMDCVKSVSCLGSEGIDTYNVNGKR